MNASQVVVLSDGEKTACISYRSCIFSLPLEEDSPKCVVKLQCNKLSSLLIALLAPALKFNVIVLFGFKYLWLDASNQLEEKKEPYIVQMYRFRLTDVGRDALAAASSDELVMDIVEDSNTSSAGVVERYRGWLRLHISYQFIRNWHAVSVNYRWVECVIRLLMYHIVFDVPRVVYLIIKRGNCVTCARGYGRCKYFEDQNYFTPGGNSGYKTCPSHTGFLGQE
ncbi:hypothetical protein EVAR_32613_1 [Eumeta japonica]|uniref:Uncharacterized protein n=1 Tax=Eumeta variegata TaxID=151549 RepID=A0A4C1WG60_EUMVA|nr:hypothetical protein EVAR_32613_1 [Eumeta japonica]